MLCLMAALRQTVVVHGIAIKRLSALLGSLAEASTVLLLGR